eukprot:TRINITY_DN20245_c0_g1_i1.p1 TRINITY_DN20245_c0_g1~~TRINITY_DN20245_c0_g1_i1.p1  ORF type:complete len:174 (-),score=23.98 TRINITY_DN20245_c0_g1_i1:7-528(-)
MSPITVKLKYRGKPMTAELDQTKSPKVFIEAVAKEVKHDPSRVTVLLAKVAIKHTTKAFPSNIIDGMPGILMCSSAAVPTAPLVGVRREVDIFKCTIKKYTDQLEAWIAEGKQYSFLIQDETNRIEHVIVTSMEDADRLHCTDDEDRVVRKAYIVFAQDWLKRVDDFRAAKQE